MLDAASAGGDAHERHHALPTSAKRGIAFLSTNRPETHGRNMYPVIDLRRTRRPPRIFYGSMRFVYRHISNFMHFGSVYDHEPAYGL